MDPLHKLLLTAVLLLLAACKHPLQIEGQGDIVELESGTRGCSLDEFEAAFTRCTDNDALVTETVVYSALPRAGWRFSHWDGFCDKESTEPDCQINYIKGFSNFWDETYPEETVPPLRAVFVESGDNPGAEYIASTFGATELNSRSPLGYGELLDALVSADNSYRYTTAQASTRSNFDRYLAYYSRQRDGLLATGDSPSSLVSGGAATKTLDLMTLVDTEPGDDNISVAYLMPKRDNAKTEEFVGTYYCANISTRDLGHASFFKAVMTGNGGGVLTMQSDRYGRSGTAAIGYQVLEDGTTTLDFLGQRLVGSLSENGSMFVGAEINSSAKGSGVCLRSSSNKTLGNARGSYYGAWMSAQPVTGVTELAVATSGFSAESVLRDSTGGRQYLLQQFFLNVFFDGKLTTDSNYGALSADDGSLFIVVTDPNKYPTLILYIRKT